MSDLIERQAAVEAIDSIDWYHQNKNKDMVSGANPAEHQAWYKAEDVYQALERQPAVESIPIKWIQGWNHFIKSPDIKRMLDGWRKENEWFN